MDELSRHHRRHRPENWQRRQPLRHVPPPNADGGGIDWAGVSAYPELMVHPITGIQAANACIQGTSYTGESGSFNLLDKGGFQVTDG